MARSLWKGPFVDTYLLKNSNNSSGKGSLKYKVQKGTKSSPIRIWSRRSFILPEFIDQFFEIYNGKQFISFQVNEDMVGHKFGEFASTRKKTLHKKDQKSK